MVRQPQATGHDFAGSGCEVGDALSRPVSQEGPLRVTRGERERSQVETGLREGVQGPFGDPSSRIVRFEGDGRGGRRDSEERRVTEDQLEKQVALWCH